MKKKTPLYCVYIQREYFAPSYRMTNLRAISARWLTWSHLWPTWARAARLQTAAPTNQDWRPWAQREAVWPKSNRTSRIPAKSLSKRTESSSVTDGKKTQSSVVLVTCVYVYRAFDSLARVLQSEDGNSYAIEGNVSEEHSTTMLELEGPLLSDMHVPFKVRGHHSSHFFSYNPKHKAGTGPECESLLYMWKFFRTFLGERLQPAHVTLKL